MHLNYLVHIYLVITVPSSPLSYSKKISSRDYLTLKNQIFFMKNVQRLALNIPTGWLTGACYFQIQVEAASSGFFHVRRRLSCFSWRTKTAKFPRESWREKKGETQDGPSLAQLTLKCSYSKRPGGKRSKGDE